MRAGPKTLERPRVERPVEDVKLETAVVTPPATALVKPEPSFAPGFAGVPVPAGGASTSASVRGLERPKAEWSARALEIAASAVEATKGKSGTQALEALVDSVLASPELAKATGRSPSRRRGTSSSRAAPTHP